ncbi:hypothetical protein [Crucivirus-326]|nr:hypothetical protein [Crucivirus-326]
MSNPNQQDDGDVSSTHSENPMQVIDLKMEAYLSVVEEMCESHAQGVGNDIYVKRIQALHVLDDILGTSKHFAVLLEDLYRSVARIPSRSVGETLKHFARTRIFRMLSEQLNNVAEMLEDVENEWNDLPAVAPTLTSDMGAPAKSVSIRAPDDDDTIVLPTVRHTRSQSRSSKGAQPSPFFK